MKLRQARKILNNESTGVIIYRLSTFNRASKRVEYAQYKKYMKQALQNNLDK